MKPHLALSAFVGAKAKLTLTIICSAIYAYLASKASKLFTHSPSMESTPIYHGADHYYNANGADVAFVTREESAFVIAPHPSTLTFSYHDVDFINPLVNHVTEGDSCVPHHLHLALGDETAEDKTAMTVSFSILNQNDESAMSTSTSCHPEDISIVLKYGVEDEQSTKMKMMKQVSTLEGGNSILNQYNATSPITFVPYVSNWLYHVPLDELEGSTKYWYQIFVFDKNDDNDDIFTFTDTKDWEEEEMEEERDQDSEDIFDLLLSSGETSTTTSIKRHERVRSHRAALRGQQKTNPIKASRSKTVLGKSPKLTFTTAPAYTSASTQPTKLAIVGDLGQTYNSSITMLNMLHQTRLDREKDGETPATAILCAGDMSYANSIQPEWDNWFDLIEPLLSQTPLMVAAGNHEIECDVETHLPFLSYENRFYMPNRLGPAIIGPADDSYFFNHTVDPWDTCATPSVFLGSYDYGNAYYSFTHGLAKVVVLSSYSDTREGSVQYNWLEQELESIDRTKTPWVIVMMHTQFYTTFLAHNDEIQTTIMREAMEPLFLRYNVNMVFSGHDHGYMRTKPVYRGEVDESGKSPVYLIVGEGGNREHHVSSYVNNDTPEDWVGVRDKTVYGFGTLEVIDESTARWKWIMDGLSDEGGGFSDDVTFTNQFI